VRGTGSQFFYCLHDKICRILLDFCVFIVFLFFVQSLFLLCGEACSLKSVNAPIFYVPTSHKPTLVLTFDDGPNPKTTPKILDCLKKHNVKAVFFVVGRNAARFPRLLKRIVEQGHELANHSYSHKSFGKISDEFQTKEIESTNKLIFPYQKEVRWFRPPYGYRGKNLTKRLRGIGMRMVMWSIDPFDWKRPTPAVICRRVLSKLRNGSIILLHDMYMQTAKALERIIIGAKNKGYRFALLSDIYGYQERVFDSCTICSVTEGVSGIEQRRMTACNVARSCEAKKFCNFSSLSKVFHREVN